MGLALSAYLVAIERGFLSREAGVKRTLVTLKFFLGSKQASSSRTTGYKGFYYHFLSPENGTRASHCELSTIDTAIFLAGALAAATYFDRDSTAECEIREIAHSVYLRANWQWALNGGRTVSHGWKPGQGFLKYRWRRYSGRFLPLYILGLGSPTYPLTWKVIGHGPQDSNGGRFLESFVAGRATFHSPTSAGLGFSRPSG